MRHVLRNVLLLVVALVGTAATPSESSEPGPVDPNISAWACADCLSVPDGEWEVWPGYFMPTWHTVYGPSGSCGPDDENCADCQRGGALEDAEVGLEATQYGGPSDQESIRKRYECTGAGRNMYIEGCTTPCYREETDVQAMALVAQQDVATMVSILETPNSSFFYNADRGAIQGRSCTDKVVFHYELDASVAARLTEALAAPR